MSNKQGIKSPETFTAWKNAAGQFVSLATSPQNLADRLGGRLIGFTPCETAVTIQRGVGTITLFAI